MRNSWDLWHARTLKSSTRCSIQIKNIRIRIATPIFFHLNTPELSSNNVQNKKGKETLQKYRLTSMPTSLTVH